MGSYSSKGPRKAIFHGNSFMALELSSFIVGGAALPFRIYSQMTATVKPPMFHFGVSGAKTSELITDFSRIAPIIKPGDVVFMNELTNQLRLTNDPDQTYADTVTYCSLVRGYGAEVVINTMPACSAAYLADDTKRTYLNNLITTNQASICDGVADVAALSAFSTVAATTDMNNYYTDNLHMSISNTQGWYTYAGPWITIANAKFQ